MTHSVGQKRLAEHDAFYAALLEKHQGLSDDESAALNARLVLIMANEIGDVDVLAAVLELARPASRS